MKSLENLLAREDIDRWVEENTVGRIYTSVKNGKAFCERCRGYIDIKALKERRQGKLTTCPVCGSKGVVRQMRYMDTDHGYGGRTWNLLIAPQKLGQSVVLRYFHSAFVYGATENSVETTEIRRDKINLRSTVGIDIYRGEWRSCDTEFRYNIYGQLLGCHINPGAYIDYVLFKADGLEEELNGTHFEGSTKVKEFCKANEFRKRDGLNWCDFEVEFWNYIYDLAWEPFYEYTEKVGFKKIREKFIQCNDGYRVGEQVNHKAKSLIDMLKVSKVEYRNLLQIGDPTMDDLKKAQVKTRYDLRTDEEYEVYKLFKSSSWSWIDCSNFEWLKKNSRFSLHKVKRYFDSSDVDADFYVSYLRLGKKLGFDLRNTGMAFPRNLEDAKKGLEIVESERKMATQIKKREKERDDQLDYVKGMLYPDSGFLFYYGDYIIRSAHTFEELVWEGFKMLHCTGKGHYVDAIRNGDIEQVLLIRRVNEPNIPFCTVEIKQGRISQWKGKAHTDPLSEVLALKPIIESALNKKCLPAVA